MGAPLVSIYRRIARLNQRSICVGQRGALSDKGFLTTRRQRQHEAFVRIMWRKSHGFLSTTNRCLRFCVRGDKDAGRGRL